MCFNLQLSTQAYVCESFILTKALLYQPKPILQITQQVQIHQIKNASLSYCCC